MELKIKDYHYNDTLLNFSINSNNIIGITGTDKNKLIDINLSKIVLISGIIGSIIGAILATKIESNNLRKYFGIFLIIIAINGSYTFISQYIKDKKDKNNLQK